MNKSELRLLEKIYAAEIDAALSNNPLVGVFQTKSKLIHKLKADGLVEEISFTLPPKPPFGSMTIKGWGLTLLGNATYCFSCVSAPDDA